MDYYLTTSAKLSANYCNAAAPTFTTTVGLQSTITKTDMENLPIFVAPQSGTIDFFTTHVAVYGPPGTKPGKVAVTVEGKPLPAGEIHVDSDLGRPVVWFAIPLHARGAGTAQVTFTGGKQKYGKTELVTTPMLHPTTTSVTVAKCG
jgi:hypothetical protein